MSFWRDTTWATVTFVGNAPAALLVSVLLARWLPPEVNGHVQAALALLALLAVVAQPGVVPAVVARLAAGAAPDRAATGALLLVTGSGLLAIALVGLLAGPVCRELLAGAPPPVLAATLALLLPTLWTNVLGGVARARDRFRDWTLAEGIQQSGRLVALAVAALVAAPGAVAALVAVGVAHLAAFGFAAARVLPSTGLGPVDRDELGRLAAFGGRSWVAVLLGQLHERADLFLLAALADAEEVAVYAVAVGIANRVRMLPLAAAAALYPRIPALPRAEAVALTRRALRAGVGTSAIVAAAVLLVAPVVPLVFGATYARSVAPLALLLPGTTLYGLHLVLGRWFQALDRQGVNVASQAVSLAVNLALNGWLIPRHGALGAAAAALVSYALQGLWMAALFRREAR